MEGLTYKTHNTVLSHLQSNRETSTINDNVREMKILDTSRVQANFRITLTEKVREKIGETEVGDIIAFYEIPDGIIIKKL